MLIKQWWYLNKRSNDKESINENVKVNGKKDKIIFTTLFCKDHSWIWNLYQFTFFDQAIFVGNQFFGVSFGCFNSFFKIFLPQAAITILSPELGAHLQSDNRALESISESPVPPPELIPQQNIISDIDGNIVHMFLYNLRSIHSCSHM